MAQGARDQDCALLESVSRNTTRPNIMNIYKDLKPTNLPTILYEGIIVQELPTTCSLWSIFRS